jgi:hypothetical protein
LEKAGDFVYANSEHLLGVRIQEEGYEEECNWIEPSRFPYAFFAAWRRTEAFFNTSANNRGNIQKNIYRVFDYGRRRGICMLGVFDCRWSTNWDYFTYWASPNFQVLQETIDRLEDAGDFWISESRHLLGTYEPHFQSGWHAGKRNL